jgi:hypothetical protein
LDSLLRGFTPFVAFARAEALHNDYEEIALDYLSTGQAIRERASPGPRLFRLD